MTSYFLYVGASSPRDVRKGLPAFAYCIWDDIALKLVQRILRRFLGPVSDYLRINW